MRWIWFIVSQDSFGTVGTVGGYQGQWAVLSGYHAQFLAEQVWGQLYRQFNWLLISKFIIHRLRII